MKNLKFGCCLGGGDFDKLLMEAKRIEESEFDSIWVTDHITSANLKKDYLNVWCYLTAYATVTNRVGLGTLVTDPCRMNPAVLAQIVATIDQISKGRMILGIGAGEAMNLVPFGIPANNRVQRMKESIQIIKGLWTTKFFDYKGQFFNFNRAHLQAPPYQNPHPPIFVSAFSPKSRKIAALEGDGWLSLAASPSIIKQGLAEIREIAEKAGRNISGLEVVYFAEFSVAEDYEKAEKTIEAGARRGLAVWPKNLRRLGYDAIDEFDYSRLIPDETTESKIKKFSETVPLEAVRVTAIYGTPQDCIKKIEEFRAAGVTYLILRPPELENNLRLFNGDIRPNLI